MSDKTCNGWSNWETWNCNLWFDDFTDQAIECIKDNFDSDNPEDRESATSILEDIIRETVTEETPILRGFFSDVISQALASINYREIAEQYISDSWDEVTAELKEDDED